MLKRPKVSNVILCDDIRTENNNKLILIGVYTADVLTQNFPVNMKLATYFTVEGAPIGQHEFEVRLISTGSTSGISGTVEVGNPNDPIIVITPPVPVVFQKAGKLKVDFRIAESGWLKVMTKEVRAGVLPRPEALP
ncbi:DUF6941 family protein [Altererythrobacter sp. Root672]|uniref:DUF6941 family protein n=1 Tax=Altererythrobacter sp. Root672 TaxID=1736584 RepID=UPI0039E07D48